LEQLLRNVPLTIKHWNISIIKLLAEGELVFGSKTGLLDFLKTDKIKLNV
jgi:hypothetical protein